MPSFTWRHGARSDVGRVRAQNEDAFLAEPDAGVFAVADGLGGHAAGEVASRLAVRTLAERLAEPDATPTGEEAAEALESIIREANARIHREAGRDAERSGMGTTVTALLLDPEGAYLLAHVGDSRAYLLRDGELRRLTRDHTYVQELVDRGRLTDEQARLHPRSSVLTRALGLEEEVAVEIHRGELRDGDGFFLATDGLTGMLPGDRLEELFRRDVPPEEAAETLVEAANRAGGGDNITVVVVRVEAAGSGAGSDA